jgi:hypothetical protein
VLAKDLAGFPNGRRLTDDVVDIALQTVEGAAQSGSIVQPLAAGDGVDQNDVAFGQTFPYLALPHGAAVNEGKATAASTGGPAAQAAAPLTAKAATKDDDSSNVALFVGLGVIVVLAAGGAAVLLRRKQA